MRRRRQRADRLLHLVPWAARTLFAREQTDPLDVGEQLVALLLDQHAAEQVAEQAHVRPQRRLGTHSGGESPAPPLQAARAPCVTQSRGPARRPSPVPGAGCACPMPRWPCDSVL